MPQFFVELETLVWQIMCLRKCEKYVCASCVRSVQRRLLINIHYISWRKCNFDVSKRRAEQQKKEEASKGRSKVCVCVRKTYLARWLIACAAKASAKYIVRLIDTSSVVIQLQLTNGSERIANGFIESSFSLQARDLFIEIDVSMICAEMQFDEATQSGHQMDRKRLIWTVLLFFFLMNDVMLPWIWCVQNTLDICFVDKTCMMIVFLPRNYIELAMQSEFFVSKFKLQCLPCSLVPKIGQCIK